MFLFFESALISVGKSYGKYLTFWDPLTPYDVIYVGDHWHQVIAWTNIGFSIRHLETYFSEFLVTVSGLTLDILKMESGMHMGCTANIIIKDIIHIFASISKNMHILLMGRRYRDAEFGRILFKKIHLKML